MGLRAKLAATVFLILLLLIAILSALEINHNMAVMVGSLSDSAELLINLTFEHLRATLKDQPLTEMTGPSAAKHDGSLQSFLRSALAFGKGAVYLTVTSPNGMMIAAVPTKNDRAAEQSRPFDELLRSARSWWPTERVRPLQSGVTFELRRTVLSNKGPFAIITVGISTALVAADVRRSVLSVVAVGGGATLISLVVTVVLTSTTLRRLSAISKGIEELAAGAKDVNLETDAKDELGSLAANFNKLSSRVSSDRAEREAERGQFFNIFRSITDGVLLLDPEGRISFANPEAYAKLGLPIGVSLDGKSLTELLGTEHPLARLVATCEASGIDLHDVALELPGSNPGTLLVSILSLGAVQEAPGLLVIARDLEPVRQLETVLDRSEELANLGRTISGIAHQLRNPLHAMSPQLELIERDVETGRPVISRVATLRRELERLDQVIEALLRFLRPHSLRLTSVQINSMIDEIATGMSCDGITVNRQFDTTLPPIEVDQTLLGEAVRNILRNAFESMPRGGTIRLQTQSTADGGIEIAITDQGEGIPSQYSERIFDFYFTTKQDGNGLGLALAAHAVKLHGGSIDVKSQVGVGTTISIRLPASIPAKEEASRRDSDRRAGLC